MAAIHAFRMRLVSPRATTAVTLGAGLLLLLCFFIQGALFIRANSPTYDEAMHLAAGYSYLATGDFRLEPQNPPLIKLFQALPLFLGYELPFNPDPQLWRDGAEFFVGQDFLYRSPLPADQMLALSRFPNLILGVGLVALTGWWAYRLWGSRAALLATALACFEPNLVAHSSLVTTDIGATLFVFLSVYLLWEYVNFPRWSLLAATGVSVGLALVSKFSAILLLPIIASIIGLAVLIVGENCTYPPLRRQSNKITGRLLHTAMVFLTILAFAILIIPAAYFLRGFQPWLFGCERFMALAQMGQPAFFFGEHSYLGWWNYFVVAFFIKTPLGSLILIAASLVFYRAGSPLVRRQAVFLLVPVAIIFFVSTQAKVNIGLRHVLPVYPFLFVLASRLATVNFHRRWLTQFVVVVLLVFTAVSTLRIAPHQLAYFNELVGGPAQGYRYLGDSNLDWGQDLKGVKTYMEKQKLPVIYLSYFGSAPPSYYGIRYQYVPGTWPLEWPPLTERVPARSPRKILAISVNNLQDVATAYDPLFRWLWLRKPVAKIGYSIFVYDLTDDREGLTKLEETYMKSGIRPFP
jgi:4-amino-4-deoxy-L-arabinose transferase-like glycosyltransferase